GRMAAALNEQTEENEEAGRSAAQGGDGERPARVVVEASAADDGQLEELGEALRPRDDQLALGQEERPAAFARPGTRRHADELGMPDRPRRPAAVVKQLADDIDTACTRPAPSAGVVSP